MNAKFYIMGLNDNRLGKVENLTYFALNQRYGEWVESGSAFDEIVMGYAHQISQAEALEFAISKAPELDVKRFLAELPPRRSTEEIWRPLDVEGMVDRWRKETRQEIVAHGGN